MGPPDRSPSSFCSLSEGGGGAGVGDRPGAGTPPLVVTGVLPTDLPESRAEAGLERRAGVQMLEIREVAPDRVTAMRPERRAPAARPGRAKRGPGARVQ